MIAVPEPAPYREATPQRVAMFMAGLYYATGRGDLWSEQVFHLTSMVAVARTPAGKESR